MTFLTHISNHVSNMLKVIVETKLLRSAGRAKYYNILLVSLVYTLHSSRG